MVNMGYSNYSKSLPTTNMHGFYVPSTKDNKGTEIQRHFSFLPLGEYVWFAQPATLCEWTRGIRVARLLASNFGDVFRFMWLVAVAPSMSNRLYFSPPHRRHIGYWLAISTRLSSVISRGCPDGYCGGKETSNCTGSASGEWWRGGGRVSCLWETQFNSPSKTGHFGLKNWFIFDQWNGFSWNKLLKSAYIRFLDACKKSIQNCFSHWWNIP